MAICDRHGLPVAVHVADASPYEPHLVAATLDARFLAALPTRLIGDRGYDSDALDQQLMTTYGIEMIAAHRRGRRQPTQDGGLQPGRLVDVASRLDRRRPRVRAGLSRVAGSAGLTHDKSSTCACSMLWRMSNTAFRCLAFAGLMVVGVAIADAAAQQYTLVSVSTTGSAGNGNSGGAVFSGDGNTVGFSSSAPDLVSGGGTGVFSGFYVRDLVTHTTTRVNVTSNGEDRPGGNGVTGAHLAIGPGISLNANGSLVAFATTQALDDADTNQLNDIYVRDRTLNLTTRVSVASDTSQSNGTSADPQISANGRYVIFTSDARNLVPGDTNGFEDVFVRDRTTLTTTRVSLSASGAELTAASYGGHISADGSIVVFLSDAPAVSTPDPTCPASDFCTRGFVRNRTTGELIRIPVPAVDNSAGMQAMALDLTPDGRFVAMELRGTLVNGLHFTPLVVYDRQTGRVEIDNLGDGSRDPGIAISGNGRIVSVGGGRLVNIGATAVDRSTLSTPFTLPAELAPGDTPLPRFSPDGLRVLVATFSSHSTDDFNQWSDVYILDLDADHDGMPDWWETQFGLNPNDPNDATLDADGDGITNLQEYQNSTNPVGTFKRYFAEGAANSFFQTRFGVFNPGNQPARIALEYLGANGETRTSYISLDAHRHTFLTLNHATYHQPDDSFSTIVEADRQVVVDRTMSWDQQGYGSHAETAIAAPATTWYLAEGSTGGAFDLFYLLQNPGDMAATVTVNYLRPSPAPPIVKTYTVAPRSRRTIYVDTEDPLLAATDLSAKITSDQRILAERAMYFSTPTQPFAAGHEGAAVTAPETSWFFAEGATGSFFDLYLLLANAETTDANVQVTYLLPSGAPIVITYLVKAQSRLTINVDNEDPRLLNTPVSSIVESTNGVPIVAERAMWWPSPNWYEAHLSAGATTTGTQWALADGSVSPNTDETYILVANTSTTPGTFDVTLYYDDAGTPASATKTFTLPANSRVNVQVSFEFPQLVAKSATFGAIIQSSGPPIVVERSMYTTVNNQTWAAGTDELATKLH
jgi:hypothetical protein